MTLGSPAQGGGPVTAGCSPAVALYTPSASAYEVTANDSKTSAEPSDVMRDSMTIEEAAEGLDAGVAETNTKMAVNTAAADIAAESLAATESKPNAQTAAHAFPETAPETAEAAARPMPSAVATAAASMTGMIADTAVHTAAQMAARSAGHATVDRTAESLAEAMVLKGCKTTDSSIGDITAVVVASTASAETNAEPVHGMVTMMPDRAPVAEHAADCAVIPTSASLHSTSNALSWRSPEMVAKETTETCDQTTMGRALANDAEAFNDTQGCTTTDITIEKVPETAADKTAAGTDSGAPSHTSVDEMIAGGHYCNAETAAGIMGGTAVLTDAANDAASVSTFAVQGATKILAETTPIQPIVATAAKVAEATAEVSFGNTMRATSDTSADTNAEVASDFAPLTNPAILATPTHAIPDSVADADLVLSASPDLMEVDAGPSAKKSTTVDDDLQLRYAGGAVLSLTPTSWCRVPPGASTVHWRHLMEWVEV